MPKKSTPKPHKTPKNYGRSFHRATMFNGVHQNDGRNRQKRQTSGNKSPKT